MTAMKYFVESVEVTQTDWGTMYVANIRLRDDVTVYRIGPAFALAELLQRVLVRFGK